MSAAVAARGAAQGADAARARSCPPSTTWSSRPVRSRCGSIPRANGAYRDGRFELYSRVNVGVAVAAQDALVVPTVFDADRKGLRQIAADARALAGKVRDGSITPPELSGGTFTVSNLGMYGIDELLRRDQRPAGGDPRGRGDRREAGRPRRRDRHRPPDAASPSPATTASSTAPTAPSSWPGSGRCSKSRSRWRSEAARSHRSGIAASNADAVRRVSRSSGRRSPRSRRRRGRSRRRRGRCRGGRRGRRSTRRGAAGSRRRGRSTSRG